MRIVKIKQYDPKFGWNILIKNFSKEDYKKLIRLLYQLGIERNRTAEKKAKFLTKRGMEKYLDTKYNSSLKKSIIKAKILLLKPIRKVIYPAVVSKIYSGNGSDIDLAYMPAKKLFASTWKSNNYTGEEFVSLYISNYEYV